MTGLHKVARHDTGTALDRLETERISRDSAEQRAGRAGRTGAGIAVRLWDPREHLRSHREREIERVDLSGPFLHVLAWGGNPMQLEWFEPPPDDRAMAAMGALERLGATRCGHLTEVGRIARRDADPPSSRPHTARGGRDVSGSSRLRRSVRRVRTSRLGGDHPFRPSLPKMSVFENIQSTVIYRKGEGLNLLSDSTTRYREETETILSMVGLKDKAQAMAGILSAGDRKRLELGIVLGTEPELLLLDEPTCGMSPMETSRTIDLIQEITKQKALTVLFTEHKMDTVFCISSYIHVMNFGVIVAAGEADQIRSNQKVQQIYFGEARCSLR